MATPALDLDGLPLQGDALRDDRLIRAGAGWTVPILPERTGPFVLDLIASYQFTRHRSNDVFYHYSSHVLGLAASIAY